MREEEKKTGKTIRSYVFKGDFTLGFFKTKHVKREKKIRGVGGKNRKSGKIKKKKMRSVNRSKCFIDYLNNSQKYG